MPGFEGTALVTGATGFVGSRLAMRLLGDGWRTHVLVRASSGLGQLTGLENALAVHGHDGSTDSLVQLVGQVRPAVVFHLASLFVAEHRPEHVAALVESNLLFGTQLLEAMAQAGVRWLVNTGTAWQHYAGRQYSPVNLYAATKQAFEAIARYYIEARGLRMLTLELSDTYGPGDPRPKLFRVLAESGESGRKLAMSPGDQLLDLVHVDDVVEAFMVAWERLRSGRGPAEEKFAVGASEPISLRALVELFGRVTGRRPDIDWGGRPYREREVMSPDRPVMRLPGWVPRIPLEEGLRSLGRPA